MHTSTRHTHGTPNSEMRLMATDSLHITPPNPSSNPAVMPDTAQMAFSHWPAMPFNSSMPSINMLLVRATIMATRPQAIALASDSPTSTRQATLPNGRIFVQTQE